MSKSPKDILANLNSLEILPSEIILEILAYLNKEELIEISFTGKKINQLSSSDVLWTKIFDKIPEPERTRLAVKKTERNLTFKQACLAILPNYKMPTKTKLNALEQLEKLAAEGNAEELNNHFTNLHSALNNENRYPVTLDIFKKMKLDDLEKILLYSTRNKKNPSAFQQIIMFVSGLNDDIAISYPLMGFDNGNILLEKLFLEKKYHWILYHCLEKNCLPSFVDRFVGEYEHNIFYFIDAHIENDLKEIIDFFFTYQDSCLKIYRNNLNPLEYFFNKLGTFARKQEWNNIILMLSWILKIPPEKRPERFNLNLAALRSFISFEKDNKKFSEYMNLFDFDKIKEATLFLAIPSRNFTAISYFATHFPSSLSFKDEKNNTALHLLLQTFDKQNDLPLLKFLLEQKPDLSIRNKKSKTVLDLVNELKDPEISQCFDQLKSDNPEPYGFK